MKGEKIRLIYGKELEKFGGKLNEQFGITEIPGKVFIRGEGKIFLFTGDYSLKEIEELGSLSFIERAGTYVAKEVEGEYRLSIEGTQIFKSQISKNIVELNDSEMEEWMMGREVLKKTGFHGFVIIKYGEDFLGTGKASEEKITNFIPKSRRLKDKNI
jgi:NOL1/NOP2/fmu family ribosome biogenesis protein